MFGGYSGGRKANEGATAGIGAHGDDGCSGVPVKAVRVALLTCLLLAVSGRADSEH